MNAADHKVNVTLAGVGLVIAGGIFGVAAREGLTLAIDEVDGVQVVVPVVNVLGALLLGYLYSALTALAPGAATVTRLKLLIGTGFCGGLTTYSSLATDTAVLLDDSRLSAGVFYALGTIVVGGAATVLGIMLGTKMHHQPQPRAAEGSRS